MIHADSLNLLLFCIVKLIHVTINLLVMEILIEIIL